MLVKMKESFQKAKLAVATTLAVGSVAVANSSVVTMAGGWEDFSSNLTSWFREGLGGPGMQGVGVAIAVIGIVAAIVSFVVHKFNPQSRMPGWITCLVIALAGTIAMSGIDKPIQMVEAIRDTIFGWMGM